MTRGREVSHSQPPNAGPPIQCLDLDDLDIIDLCAICDDWVIDRAGQISHITPTDHQAIRSDTVGITGAVVAVRRLSAQLCRALARLTDEQTQRPDTTTAIREVHVVTGEVLAAPEESVA